MNRASAPVAALHRARLGKGTSFTRAVRPSRHHASAPEVLVGTRKSHTPPPAPKACNSERSPPSPEESAVNFVTAPARNTPSRKAAKKCSPRRKPWDRTPRKSQSPEGGEREPRQSLMHPWQTTGACPERLSAAKESNEAMAAEKPRNDTARCDENVLAPWHQDNLV